MLDKEELIVAIGYEKSGVDQGCINYQVWIQRVGVGRMSDADFSELLRCIDATKKSCIDARVRSRIAYPAKGDTPAGSTIGAVEGSE